MSQFSPQAPQRVRWIDTPDSYGWISRALHWGLAALILWQFLGMAAKVLLGRVPLAGFFVGLHQPIGAVIFALVVLRILWALAMRGRRPGHSGLAGLAARLGHLVLYLLMAAIPTLGLLRAFGNTRAFAPWGIEIFPSRDTEIAWMVALANQWHGLLGWTLLVVIAGHVGAALVHQLVIRDRVLRRMAG